MTEQAIFLGEHGWQIHLTTSPGREFEDLRASIATSNKVILHSIPMERNPSPWKDLASLFAWFRLLHTLKPNMVMVGTPKAGLLGILTAWFLNIRRRTYFVRGLRLEGLSGFGGRVAFGFEWLTCKASTNVLCVSHSLRAQMIERRLVRPNKVRVLGLGSSNGVNTLKFRPPTAQERDAARLGFGIDNETFVIGFAGRLHPDKGLQDLLHAMEILWMSHPNSILLLAGAADYRHSAISFDQEKHQQNRVRFTGYLENMVDFYHSLDLFCLPSHREGMPNVNLEAAACALPVVTTTATGCIDSVIPGKTGLVVPSQDVAALASALEQLEEDKHLRQSLGEEGRVMVETEFEQSQVWRKQLQYLEEQISR